ncbi:MAG: hypothetical protein ABIH20_00925 [Candidatus Diapherotrites archaeon]
MAIEVMVRKWGNSMGVLLPKELVEKEKLREREMIIIEVVREFNLSKIFGSLPKRTMSGQKFKGMVRKGWE